MKLEFEQHAAKVARERAKENAELASAEASAAAVEWKRVYALRLEREQADQRARLANQTLESIQEQTALKYVIVTLAEEGHALVITKLWTVLVTQDVGSSITPGE